MLKVLSVLKCHVRPVHRSFSVSCLKWTYYDILGVKTDASQEEIRDSFLKKSKDLHPDSSSKKEKDGHLKFVELNEAYNVLVKEKSRKIYDSGLSLGPRINDSDLGRSPKANAFSKEINFMLGAIFVTFLAFAIMEISSLDSKKDLAKLEKERTLWLIARQNKKSTDTED